MINDVLYGIRITDRCNWSIYILMINDVLYCICITDRCIGVFTY